ncbi:MAG: mannonate dehydratase [Hyphomicrobiales bacterium]
MDIGEQLIDPSEDRLRLSAQLGVKRIVIDSRPNRQLLGEHGCWDAGKVAAQRQWVESFGLALEVLALDVSSILLDSLRAPDRASAIAERLRNDIRAAAEGGVATLKYNAQMVGITRTGFVEGRGGVRCSAFRAADYSPDKDDRYSYWGVAHPGSGLRGADAAVKPGGNPEACGQVLGSEAGGVTQAEGWQALEYLVEAILPTAERSGVRLAAHPQDPAYPPGGLNGVNHVLGSVAGMRRFLDLAPENPAHGFNFCQGAIAEMSEHPTETVLAAIREFGARKRIFMVHFRNIKGGYLDFRECFPDEGSVDMPACIRAYRAADYDGILCPDHVPLSDLDPGRERFFAFALGYTRALIQASATERPSSSVQGG